ncbi:hypothetical protein F441_16352 [Phytophthora nicotianae CJ01A1]|uniref:Uncharacterized protein n=5 Tax=Phytophthora nicotianae TaxID=4792 RepID=W2PT53_PHYN3|nr:hypothetical protein PPTG_16145 [Phytophthora nicotianae INRA-310]ETI37472.1 hypothetical protein F443_16540 [Phytophthora nicotianae P1569]ETK77701.1 hypothetical protein L915_16068 [Phytophthora nicotianae]ETO66251.1 hypothetical protein F444_16512 [Phytophthora nicotianae P1976]ETP07350.1 hypothetical protein F441_16352 [Phytophthora nicotianae CJ01A1]ETL31145.1 hypothetical protein L916_15958 [Phytophthora nicotianae]
MWKFSDRREGTNALSGADLDRYQSLAAANALVPSEQQLKLCIAGLQYRPTGYYGWWDGSDVPQNVSWFSLSGQKLGNGSTTSLKWTEKLRFLNPGNETFSQLWKQFGEDSLATQERYAIVGWPASTNINSIIKLMGDIAAAEMALSDNRVDMIKVKEILQYRSEQERQEPPYRYGYGYDEYGYSTQCHYIFVKRFVRRSLTRGTWQLSKCFSRRVSLDSRKSVN